MWPGLLRSWRSISATGPPPWKSIVLSESAEVREREGRPYGQGHTRQLRLSPDILTSMMTWHSLSCTPYIPSADAVSRVSGHLGQPAVILQWHTTGHNPACVPSSMIFTHTLIDHTTETAKYWTHSLVLLPSVQEREGQSRYVEASGASSSRMFQRGTHINRSPLHSWPDKAPSASIQKLRRSLPRH